MNIELTALEAGSLVFFSIAIVGMVMALRLRSRRKKKRQVKQDVEEYEFKTNPERGVFNHFSTLRSIAA